MKSLASFTLGVLFTIVVFYLVAPRATYIETPTGWKLEHIPMPPCPEDHDRTIDMPERDLNAFTLVCEKDQSEDDDDQLTTFYRAK